ncbi:hypothetical protein GCM10007052_25900 [Halioglobus japonicus]|uniref:copper chaperone PCu(A)C n=1 Tax=Halioglobus TaxID=1217416 RepID=UPI0014742F50|nr:MULTISPECIES: copper chaperone PCu(A)C [Halioglobus]GHD18495.1 hypothetical protein GCM10007052_25900 [Halioglobus japonicus]
MLFRTRVFAAVLAALPLVATASSLTIDDAWVRALPPVQKTTAAYLSLSNSGSEPAEVVAATVSGAGKVEIHTTAEVDGLLRMMELTTLTVAPGDTVALAPGGTHLMLFDLEAMPQPGQTRTLCLTFASGEELCTEAEVRKSAASAGDHHHHHH